MIINIISIILFKSTKSLFKSVKTYQTGNITIIHGKKPIVTGFIGDNFYRMVSNYKEELYILKYILAFENYYIGEIHDNIFGAYSRKKY